MLNIYLIFYFKGTLGRWFILALGINILYVVIININTFKMIKKNFVVQDAESNDKEDLFFPWCIDLYSKEKYIVNTINITNPKFIKCPRCKKFTTN